MEMKKRIAINAHNLTGITNQEFTFNVMLYLNSNKENMLTIY